MLLLSWIQPAYAVDGDLDASFTPNIGSAVNAIAVQADNKLVVGGVFNNVGDNVARNGITRLNVDGTLDNGFVPPLNSANSRTVSALQVQSDGKILLGGNFANIGGVAMTANLARLDPDGSVDADFTPNASSAIRAISLQASDDNILIGGTFTSIDDETHNRLARLENDILPEVGFTVPAPDQALSLAEGSDEDTTFEFSVSRTGSINNVSSVDYVVSTGAPNRASADDFAGDVFAQGRLDFDNGESTSQTISVIVSGDTQAENDEAFVVSLINPVNAILGASTWHY